jgi:hypothetical protein
VKTHLHKRHQRCSNAQSQGEILHPQKCQDFMFACKLPMFLAALQYASCRRRDLEDAGTQTVNPIQRCQKNTKDAVAEKEAAMQHVCDAE